MNDPIWDSRTATLAVRTVDPEATLIRFGSNGVFVSSVAPVVFRVAPLRASEVVQSNAATVEQLLNKGAPVMAPVLVNGQSIWATEYGIVTAWERLSSIDNDAFRLGQLLKTLDELHSVSVVAGLAHWNAVDRTLARLERLSESPFRMSIPYLSDELHRLEQVVSKTTLGTSLIHGDAHPSNLMVRANGKPLFVDLDDIALGPTAWDLAPVVTASRRFSLAPRTRTVARRFLTRLELDHGTSPLEWVRLRELTMTTWLMENWREGEKVVVECDLRLRTLRDDDDRPWTPF